MFCIKCGSKCEEYQDGDILRQRCPACGTIHYRNPFPCIAVLILNSKGEVLLGKRHEDSIYPGKWCLPCGYMEYDETYVEAAIREVREEAGIEILPEGIINVVSNHFGNGVKSLVVVLIAHYQGDKAPSPGDDMTEVGWFSMEDMEKLPPLAFQADVFIMGKYKRMTEDGRMTAVTLEGNRFIESKDF